MHLKIRILLETVFQKDPEVTFFMNSSCDFFFLLFLSEGDRIIKVNGESVIGKTYSQVIALIQNR